MNLGSKILLSLSMILGGLCEFKDLTEYIRPKFSFNKVDDKVVYSFSNEKTI
jgi:hypothetical protein